MVVEAGRRPGPVDGAVDGIGQIRRIAVADRPPAGGCRRRGRFVQVRRGAFTAVVVAGSLALAACTGGGESPPSATSSTTSSSSSSTTSSTTTQSPSATKTVALPPEATKHTEAGAKAFAKYFVSVLDDSQVSADPTALKAVSGEACKGCKVYIDMSHDLAVKGQRQQRPPCR